MCEEVSEILEVAVRQVPELHGHRSGVADASAGLVLAHRLEQIVLTLVRQARHLLATGEIGIVADGAVVLRRKRPAPSRARRIGRLGRRLRRRQLREVVGDLAQIVVGQVLGGGGHRGAATAPVAEQEQLGDREELRLAGERRRLRDSREPAGAVTSQAHGHALLERRGDGGRREDQNRERDEQDGSGRERRARSRPGGTPQRE
jgi:hypothetical protein